MTEVRVFKLHCKRCNHIWIPRKPKVHVCPHCHSFLWYKEKETESDKLVNDSVVS